VYAWLFFIRKCGDGDGERGMDGENEEGEATALVERGAERDRGSSTPAREFSLGLG